MKKEEKTIKAIIFDLGSVCLHIDWFKINEEVMKRFGVSTLVKSSGNQNLIKTYNEALEGKKETSKFFKELNNYKDNTSKLITFYKFLYSKYKKQNKEIFNLIKNLRRSLKIFCLTDTNTLHLETHKEQGITDKFDEVFTSFELGSRKEDRNTFIKVLNKTQFKPQEIIFIDDNERNIENAKSLGINAIKYESYEKLIKDLNKLGVKI